MKKMAVAIPFLLLLLLFCGCGDSEDLRVYRSNQHHFKRIDRRSVVVYRQVMANNDNLILVTDRESYADSVLAVLEKQCPYHNKEIK